jgi:hypothetical protein
MRDTVQYCHMLILLYTFLLLKAISCSPEQVMMVWWP